MIYKLLTRKEYSDQSLLSLVVGPPSRTFTEANGNDNFYIGLLFHFVAFTFPPNLTLCCKKKKKTHLIQCQYLMFLVASLILHETALTIQDLITD